MNDSTPRLTLIVAMDEGGLIGKEGDLPWHLPADLKHFKAMTLNKPIVMGRKTWDSIGRPLPGRTSIVLTRDRQFQAEGAKVAHDADEALRLTAPAPEVMIIGGASIYELFLPRARRILLTRIHTSLEGDTRFPALDAACWQEVQREDHSADDRNRYDYSFLTLERRD